MSVTDIFRKKSKEVTIKETRTDASEKKAVPRISFLNQEKKHRTVLKRPWVSEKATDLGKINQYLFFVGTHANKPSIKKEVQNRYNVAVQGVNIIIEKGKTKQFGRRAYKKPDMKKAIVTLKEGQKIEIQ